MVKFSNDFTVYEAVNEEAREIYIGATRHPMYETIEALHRSLPRCIHHWDFDDVSTVRSVEFHLTEPEAHAFIERRAKGKGAPGYKYFTEETCDEPFRRHSPSA